MPKVVTNRMGSFKKGGIVKKTGDYMLHKGEKVVTSSKAKALSKLKK